VSSEEIISEEKEVDTSESEMTFLEHLEEFRWRVIYSLIGIVIATVVAWVFIDFLVEKVLLLPASEAKIQLQNLKPFGQLFIYLQVAFIAGFILSIPNFFYHFWKFISPALKSSEKKYVVWIVLFSSICFLTGIVFAYYVMLPFTLKFAAQFGTEIIENNFSIDEYFSIIFSVMLAAGLVFELPMLSFFLSKIGILNPSIMRRFRRHSIVTIMILSAILTPGTDPVAQVLLAIPLVLLYEISIFVSKIFSKKSIE
jgi:sec-independent protein translocase protein TatC